MTSAGGIEVIDSHTEGEPTRVVIAGAPDFGGGAVASQAALFRERFDWFRSAVVNEPRGYDALVGAVMVPSAKADFGVIFFNNVGLLHACGHGTIGLGATLKYLGRVAGEKFTLETPVGIVNVRVGEAGRVSIDNVPSYRHAVDVAVTFRHLGEERTVRGDIAWGGNWFFLVSEHGMELSLQNLDELTSYSWAIRQALERAGVTGANGGLIDHVELFGPPTRTDCDSRNFVLCPGRAYDRSPCGTGTSAKMACLHAAGKLREGQEWRQESVIGSRFVGSVRMVDGKLIPTISGQAFVTARSTLVLSEGDPFIHGIRGM
jgi:4-hydroxyproline epimerase